MAFNLAIAPDKDGYTATPFTPTLSVELEGGPPRFRRGPRNGLAKVSVKWTVGPDDHDYLFAFYDAITENPNVPFEAELLLKNSNLDTFNCYFNPAQPMVLQSHSGLTYIIGAGLLVIQKDIVSGENESFIDVYNAFGPDFIVWLNRIHHDVNVEYPKFL